MGGGGWRGEDARGRQRRMRKRREKQDSMEGKASVGAGCKWEGQEETEVAMRPSSQRGPGYNIKRPGRTATHLGPFSIETASLLSQFLLALPACNQLLPLPSLPCYPGFLPYLNLSSHVLILPLVSLVLKCTADLDTGWPDGFLF